MRSLATMGFVLLGSLSRKRMREKYRRTNGVTVPGSAFISVSQKCNLGCRGCIAAGCQQSSLDAKTCMSIVSQCARIGVNSFIFIGGEPLIDASFSIIEQLAQRYRYFNFNIVTNGTLIDDDMADRLANLRNLIVFVSVDGPEMAHETRRGAKSYQATVANIERLASRKVPFFIISTLTRQSKRLILSDDFVSFCRSTGALGLVTLPYMRTGSDADEEYALEEHDLVDIVQISRTIRNKFAPFFTLDILEGERRFGGCRAASRTISFSSDGSIQVCPAIMYSNLSVYEHSVEDALRSDIFRQCRDIQQRCPGKCLIWNRASELEKMLKMLPDAKKTSVGADDILRQRKSSCG